MELLSRPTPLADHRIAYGDHPSQFGELWLPKGNGPHPVVVFFHGGWWKSEYDLGYAGHLCAALKHAGIATWSVEYRRVGSTGGGWPATFHDAAAGFDHIATLAKQYPLDLSRVLTAGHSAGGHLAFWIAGRHHIPAGGELVSTASHIPLRGTVALAGAVGLQLTAELAGDGIFAHDRDEVYRLMGGSPQDRPARYYAGDPAKLLPLCAPQLIIQGTGDDQIPPQLPARWSALRGSQATTTLIAGADHFDVVDPQSAAWPAVLAAMRSLLAT